MNQGQKIDAVAEWLQTHESWEDLYYLLSHEQLEKLFDMLEHQGVILVGSKVS